MRDRLELLQGQRITIRAFFHRFGYTRREGMSVLLEKITGENGLLTEHAWIPYSEEFKSISLTSGDRIELDVLVKAYDKQDGVDYGFGDIQNIKMYEKGKKIINLDNVSYFSFTVKKERAVWSKIKGDKEVFIHNEKRQVQKDITILQGDRIEIELHKIKENKDIEFVWRIEREGRWNKHALFNPLKYGQALHIYNNYRIYLSEFVYFALKDFYFKVYFSKTDIEIPYTHELVHYSKPTKFKYRKVINYDINGNLIQDETVIKEREYIFNHSTEIMNSMSKEEIFTLFEEQYGTTKGLQPFLNPHNPYYNDLVFLYKKAENTLQSSPVDVKNKVVDYFILYLQNKGYNIVELIANNEKNTDNINIFS